MRRWRVTPNLQVVVIDLGGVGRLDYSGAAALGRIIEELRHAEVTVHVTNVPPGAAQAAALHFPEHDSSAAAAVREIFEERDTDRRSEPPSDPPSSSQSQDE